MQGDGPGQGVWDEVLRAASGSLRGCWFGPPIPAQDVEEDSCRGPTRLHPPPRWARALMMKVGDGLDGYLEETGRIGPPNSALSPSIYWEVQGRGGDPPRIGKDECDPPGPALEQRAVQPRPRRSAPPSRCKTLKEGAGESPG